MHRRDADIRSNIPLRKHVFQPRPPQQRHPITRRSIQRQQLILPLRLGPIKPLRYYAPKALPRGPRFHQSQIGRPIQRQHHAGDRGHHRGARGLTGQQVRERAGEVAWQVEAARAVRAVGKLEVFAQAPADDCAHALCALAGAQEQGAGRQFQALRRGQGGEVVRTQGRHGAESRVHARDLFGCGYGALARGAAHGRYNVAGTAPIARFP